MSLGLSIPHDSKNPEPVCWHHLILSDSDFQYNGEKEEKEEENIQQQQEGQSRRRRHHHLLLSEKARYKLDDFERK